MRGTVYRQCWCRDRETNRLLRAKCPKLKQKGHGSWYGRYDIDPGDGGKRRQPVIGPFDTKKKAEEELTEALARVGGGASVPDRSLRVESYLTGYLAGKRNLKPRTRESSAEAYRLYWIPGLGRMRLVDVRDHHVSQVITAMELINRPVPDDTPPELAEMLRRMYAARADDERRELAEGETRRKKSVKPLSPSRIERVYAPFRAAMNAAVPRKVGTSPCAGVELPWAPHHKPLAWTPPRETAFRAELARRGAKQESALEGRVLTAAEWQAIWADPELRPAPAMVWMPAHTGRFLDYLADTGERLAALYTLTAYIGLRRDEIVGLTWGEVDLDQAVADIRETGGGTGPKSDAGVRVVPLPPPVVEALRAWRKTQAADKLAWGPGWPDELNLVFTREDGTPVPPQWVSVRFEILAYRCGLPPVRFHDLRHGAASLLKAAKVDTKIISAILGHTRTSFTDAVYGALFPEVVESAMTAAAAIVPRRKLAQDS